MIQDFVRTCEERLAARQKDYLEKLVGTSTNQETNRGIIQGLAMARETVLEVAREFNAEDSEDQAEAMQKVAPMVRPGAVRRAR